MGKISTVAEAAYSGDILCGKCGILQKFLSFGYAQPHQIFSKRKTCNLLKYMGKGGLAHKGYFANILQIKLFGKMLVQIC